MRKSVVCTDADVELVHAAPCVPACQRYVWGGCEICDAWRIRAGVTEPVQRHGQAESSHARYLAIRPYCSPGTDGYPTKIPSTSPSAPTNRPRPGGNVWARTDRLIRFCGSLSIYNWATFAEVWDFTQGSIGIVAQFALLRVLNTCNRPGGRVPSTSTAPHPPAASVGSSEPAAGPARRR